MACGGAPARNDPTKWDTAVKMRHVSKEEVVAVLRQVEGQEIVDMREV
jgi:hypothetical protein